MAPGLSIEASCILCALARPPGLGYRGEKSVREKPFLNVVEFLEKGTYFIIFYCFKNLSCLLESLGHVNGDYWNRAKLFSISIQSVEKNTNKMQHPMITYIGILTFVPK